MRTIQLAGLLLGIAVFGPRFASGQDTRKPNFVIMIADDVGWNDIGAYGHPNVKTPHLDSLATEGMRFDAAFLTCSSCSPSRCSIMTGRYPHATGAAELHMPLPSDQATIPGLLKKAGYYTASAGKWHLGDAAKKDFDLVVGGSPSGCENWLATLRDRPKDRPFFLWLAAVDAHRPYSENAISAPHTPDDAVVPPYLADIPETRQDLALYYDEISRLDSYLGQVVDELARQGVADSTFVLFMADNGRPFPRCKTTVYDSGVRTPFIVRFPQLVQPGTVCQQLVSAVDIGPTIAELAGLQESSTFQGKPFSTLLREPSRSIRDFVFAEHNWHDYQAFERAVRSEKWLYIRNEFPELPATPPADAVRSMTHQAMQRLHAQGELPPEQQTCFVAPRSRDELYDVDADPFSLKNLAENPQYEERLNLMRKALLEWQQETQDRVPANPTPDGFDRQTGERLPNP